MSSFNIIQWNMKGFFNNYHELESILKDYSPQFMSIQETHLPFKSNPNTPSQYSSYFSNLPHISTNKQGIAVLIKNHIPHKRIEFQSNLSNIIIELNFGFKFHIISIYIPPAQQFRPSELTDILNSIHTPFILIGDFNAWNPLWGSARSNARGDALESIILAYGLTVLNDGAPTHFTTHRSFTNVDLSICSNSLAPKAECKTFNNLFGSDHYPMLTSLSIGAAKKILPKPKFIIEHADWIKFAKISSELTSTTPISNNINKEAANITKIIREAAHRSIPQTHFRPLKRAVPWWNKDLATLRDNKQKLWSAFRRFSSTENLVAYKKANALFKRSAKSAKRDSFQKFTNSINQYSCPKKLWSDIKRLTGNSNNNFISHIDTPSSSLSDSSDIANFFAETWSKYSDDDNFAQNFISQKQKVLSESYSATNISLKAKKINDDISPGEYDAALSATKGKTPGADRIPYPIIKKLPPSVKLRLINLYNSILEYGIYPQAWKQASVIPLSKPGKCRSKVDGFRPISLLSCLGKTLEKIVAKRIMWYAQSNNLLSHNQVAFKSKQGTLDALLHFEHFATSAIAKRHHVSALSLDFEKAFDRIGAHVVLHQLSKWKVGKKIYSFVKSFLHNRKFKVVINNTASDNYNLFNGIPQGSPLSVALFTIAFNEVSAIISSFKNIDHYIYADDVLIFTQLTDLCHVENTFNNILNKISVWSMTSGANINYTKSNTFHICKKINCNSVNLSFNNINISSLGSIKILGIIFDNKLKFKHHCEYVKNSIARRLKIIKYLSSSKSLIHPSILTNITRSLILSKIDYGLAIYGHCAELHLKLIKPAYHTAVRCSLRAFPTSPTRCLLAEAGLPSIEDRVISATLKIIPKLWLCHNKINHSIAMKCLNYRRVHGRNSTIQSAVNHAKDISIDTLPVYIPPPRAPPWHLSSSMFILDLLNFKKSSTIAAIYQQQFYKIREELSNKGWSFVFTDGSKSKFHTSFAVVTSGNTRIANGLLQNYCSVFTAEATALYLAVKFAAESNGNFVICSDSNSVIEATSNYTYQGQLVNLIRDTLICNNNKIKIMWVPGHCQIPGNELADKRAKEATTEPLYCAKFVEKHDLVAVINSHMGAALYEKWSKFNHRYKRFNPSNSKPHIPINSPCSKIKLITRIRLGHTNFTHQHLLNNNTPPCCPFCTTQITNIDHILFDCPQLSHIRTQCFQIQSITNILSNPTERNIELMYNFLSKINFVNKI